MQATTHAAISPISIHGYVNNFVDKQTNDSLLIITTLTSNYSEITIGGKKEIHKFKNTSKRQRDFTTRSNRSGYMSEQQRHTWPNSHHYHRRSLILSIIVSIFFYFFFVNKIAYEIHCILLLRSR